MLRRSVIGAGVLIALAVAGTGVARAASTIVLPRAGQVGIALQGAGGTLFSSGDLGDEFGAGPGVAVRLRYRMRYERAMGLSFESHSLDARSPSGRAGAFDSLLDAPATLRDRVHLTLAGFDLYQLFDTRSRTTKFLGASLGLVSVNAHLTDGETQFPIDGDGFYLGAGAGLERFFFRSWAWDAEAHYNAAFHGGTVNHFVNASLGLVFYAAY